MKASVNRRLRRWLGTTAALGLAALALAPAASARDYSVTITNLTSGQPFSPPVIATHYGGGAIFSWGRYSSYGVWKVAENGDSMPLQNELAWKQYYRWVSQYTTSPTPLVPPGRPGSARFGRTVTLRISAGQGYDRFSWASMLGCTNDGFTGVDSLALPQRRGQTVASWSYGYDAGTEYNTEAFADLPQGCQDAIAGSRAGTQGTNQSNSRLWEGRPINWHGGVYGRSNDGLTPAIHGWTWNRPVGYVSITALN